MDGFLKWLGRLASGPTFLDGLGPVALADRRLILFVLALMIFVVVPVFLLTPLFAWRYRHGNTGATYKPRWTFSWPLELLIWGVPVAVVAVLSVTLWRETHRLDPYKAIDPHAAVLDIQVIGLDWKWLFIYPAQHIAVVNEMAFPAGRPVRLTITSGTVMQSFMIPALSGQIYAMAGMTTQLHVQARATGRFTGENTQYNGEGFPRQRFQAQAMTEEGFAAWAARIGQENQSLDEAAYAALSRRATVASPMYFSAVKADFFRHVVERYQRGPGADGRHQGDHVHE